MLGEQRQVHAYPKHSSKNTERYATLDAKVHSEEHLYGPKRREQPNKFRNTDIEVNKARPTD